MRTRIVSGSTARTTFGRRVYVSIVRPLSLVSTLRAEHSGLRFRVATPAGADDRLVHLGDDGVGMPLEVVAVELGPDKLLVIHAMPLRDKYLA